MPVFLSVVRKKNSERISEATSAIGTVGLSADLTPSLTRGSHVILMILMYVGRIGPITMALVFAGREDMQAKFRDLPEKRIMLG